MNWGGRTTGIEPAYNGATNHCLTTWRRPPLKLFFIMSIFCINVKIKNYYFIDFTLVSNQIRQQIHTSENLTAETPGTSYFEPFLWRDLYPIQEYTP